MLHLFNRREVGVTMDFGQLSAMQNALIDAGIPYCVRSKTQGASLSTTGSLIQAPHTHTHYTTKAKPFVVYRHRRRLPRKGRGGRAINPI